MVFLSSALLDELNILNTFNFQVSLSEFSSNGSLTMKIFVPYKNKSDVFLVKCEQKSDGSVEFSSLYRNDTTTYPSIEPIIADIFYLQ